MADIRNGQMYALNWLMEDLTPPQTHSIIYEISFDKIPKLNLKSVLW